MFKTLHFKSLFLLLCLIIGGSSSAWGDTVTYTFSDNSWHASPANWASGKAGNGYTNNQGLQVTTGTSGANATSPASFNNISKIVVNYCTNASKGAGTITVKVGTNSEKSFSITKPSSGGTTLKNAEFNYSQAESGSVKLTVECTENSVYINSISITYSNKTPAGLTYSTNSYNNILPLSSFEAPTLTNPNNLSVSYESSDADIANVDASTGAVSIGSKEGTATITASSAETETYAAGSASYTITVAKGTTSVTLNNTALTFNIIDGTTQTLTATAKYGDTELDAPAITWSSDHENVARVVDGVITAVAPGNATITANYAGNTFYKSSSNTCSVTVNKANTTLTINKSEASIDLINADKTTTLTATVKATKSDNSQKDVANPTVTWTSSDPTVATVSENGVVSALKVGTTTITASYAGGGNYNAATDATCTITVTDSRDAVNIISFSAATNPIVKGNTTATTVTNDQDGWTKAYTYTSSDTDVAEIAADGTITAKAKGTTEITVALNMNFNDPAYKAGETTSNTFTLTVTNAFHTASFSVNGTIDDAASVSVEEGEAITFPANPVDNNGFSFVGWAEGTIEGTTNTAPALVNAPVMGENDIKYIAVFAEVTPAVHDFVTDVLTRETTGVTGTSYTNWSGKNVTSSATYAGKSAGGNSSIQMRNQDSSGIITTKSGGYIAKITIDWNSNTTNNRHLTVYGSNSAYTNPSQLYSTNTQGANLGTIVYGSSTELEITGNYAFIGLLANDPLYMNSISITWDNGTPASYENYCTTIPTLPKPEIEMADVEMIWGETDKSVAPSATVSGVAYEGSFTYTSSDANLTVGADGKLTCNDPGTYTVTASIEATSTHRAAEKTCNVTVNKRNTTLTFANTEVQLLKSDATEYTQAVSVTEDFDGNSYDGTVTYALTANTANATISGTTVSFTNTGNITVTATAPATDKYNETSASYTLAIRTTPTFELADQTIAFGETYTVTGVTGGNMTVSSNNDVATVDGNVITGAAVGSAIITVSTAADDTYIAGEETFEIVVTGVTAMDETPAAGDETIFYESFDKNNGTGGNDNQWSGNNIATGTIQTDISGWSMSNEYRANKCIKLGTSSKLGKATTPTLNLVSGVTYTLSFRAGAWNGKSTNLKISMTNGTLSASSVTMKNAAFDNFELTITNASANAKITFEGNTSSDSQFFLDEVKVTKPGEAVASVSAKIPASGFGSFCSLYPLNLPADNDDCKAYIVTNVEGTQVTFTQVSGEIKGGVPLILRGTQGTYDLPTAASSTTVPDGNWLVGTLAPTYVTQTEGDKTNFGLSNGTFKKIVDGVMPANKAYLPIPTSYYTEGARFNMVFDDETTTTIKGVTTQKEVGAVYNLSGQRIDNPKKGGLYIVNGKKVVMK